MLVSDTLALPMPSSTGSFRTGSSCTSPSNLCKLRGRKSFGGFANRSEIIFVFKKNRGFVALVPFSMMNRTRPWQVR